MNNLENEEIKETIEVSESLDSNMQQEIENVTVKENIDSIEENVEKKGFSKAKGITATVTALAVVIVGYSVLSTSGLVNVSMDAKYNDLKYQDNSLVYDIDVSDVKSSNTIYFDVLDHNKSVLKYTIEFSNSYTGNLTGSFSLSDLKINEKYDGEALEYTIRLCGDTGLVDRTYDSYILKIDNVLSEFKTVSYKCDCANSGYFLFDMDFVDDYGQFNDFKAYLVDESNQKNYCSFSDNLHETQKIYALDLDSNAKFVLLVNKNNQKDETGELVYEELFSSDVTL